MSARIMITCNGDRHGQPCRGALPTRALDVVGARAAAARAGWTRHPDWMDHPDDDYCPACTAGTIPTFDPVGGRYGGA